MTNLQTDRYLNQIVTILRNALEEQRCEVYIFGSRARGDAHPGSDLDIGVLADRPVRRSLSVARERLEESTIPLVIDLVDLSEAPDILKRVREEGILVWTN